MMRWYVSRNGETTGPVEEDQVAAWVRAGMVDAQLRGEAGGPWMSVQQSPFAAFMPAQRPASAAPQAGTILVLCGALVVALLVGKSIVDSGSSSPSISRPTRPSTAAVAQEPIEPGVGLTRTSLTVAYEADDFTFEPSSPVKGQPRTVGKSMDGLTMVELIGPSEDLRSATLMQGVGKKNLGTATAHVTLFLQRTAPEWDGALKWFGDALKSDAEEESTVVHGTKLFTLQPLPQLGLLTLSVRRAGASAPPAGSP
jgi:hypothetical protein